MASSHTFPSGLTDREAVVDALNAYTQALDEGSVDLFRACTTADMVLDLTPFNERGHDYKPMDGQDAVVAAILEGVGRMPTSHHLTNFRVWLDGSGGARFQCYVLAHHHKVMKEPREDPDNFYNVGGRYEGEAVRQDGQWLIKSIKITPWWIVGNVEVLKARVENHS